MTNEHPALATAWKDQRKWSLAADGLKSALGWAGCWALALGVLGAVLETAASQVGGPEELAPALALLGAAALAVSAIVATRLIGKEEQRSWIRARAVSEGLKSEIYQFLSRLSAERDPEALSARALKIKNDAQDLQTRIAPYEADAKAAPDFEGVAGYIDKRVTEQAEGYYEPQARREAKSAGNYRRLQLVLTIVAAVLSVVAGFPVLGASKAIGAWVAVVTTISTSFAAHAAAGRHEFLAVSYSATAAELLHLRDSFDPSMASSEEARRFVEKCESVISAQNQSWMGRAPSTDK